MMPTAKDALAELMRKTNELVEQVCRHDYWH